MKRLTTYLNERLIVNKKYINNKISVKSLKELKSIIKDRSIDSNTKEFNRNINLTDIDVSKLDDLSETFLWWKFETIDISGWDTSNVKNMKMMFYGCEQLKDIIGIENINIDNVENMEHMFDGCKKLDITDKIKEWEIDPRIISAKFMFNDSLTEFKFTRKY